MKIELKNIKHSDFASHETYCYEATLYIDGKRTAIVSNDGNGGCDMCEPVSVKGGGILNRDPEAIKRLKAADEWLKENGDHREYDGLTIEEDLEMRCHQLVTDWLRMKDVKRILKKVAYVKPDGKVYTLAAKYKPTPALLADMKARAPWWKNEYILLNELPVEKAAELIKKAV